jgi:hypothetical protein
MFTYKFDSNNYFIQYKAYFYNNSSNLDFPYNNITCNSF